MSGFFIATECPSAIKWCYMPWNTMPHRKLTVTMGECHKNNIEQEKPDTKEHIILFL